MNNSTDNLLDTFSPSSTGAPGLEEPCRQSRPPLPPCCQPRTPDCSCSPINVTSATPTQLPVPGVDTTTNAPVSNLNAEATCYYSSSSNKPRGQMRPDEECSGEVGVEEGRSAAEGGDSTGVVLSSTSRTPQQPTAFKTGGYPSFPIASVTAAAMVPPSTLPMDGGFGSGSLPLPRSTPKTPKPSGVALGRVPGVNLDHQQQVYDYILVLDFEATCQENNFSFPNEIIEFPVILVDTARNAVVGQFHSFVKPTRFGGKLTDFCTELTGIAQGVVDAAPKLETVITDFNTWLNKVIPFGKRVIFATDGPTDMENFMYKHSVLREGVSFPRIFFTYLDVRRCFCNFTCNYRRNLGPLAMLAELGLSFEGRQHSGLDDTRNIARIVMAMLSRGFVFFEAFSVNELGSHGLSAGGPPNYNSHLGFSPRPMLPTHMLAVANSLGSGGSYGNALVFPINGNTTSNTSCGSPTITSRMSAPSPPCAMGVLEQQDQQKGEEEGGIPSSSKRSLGIVDDDEEPYLLPKAAVDIVNSSPISPTPQAAKKVMHQDPSQRKRFATKRSAGSLAQGNAAGSTVANSYSSGKTTTPTTTTTTPTTTTTTTSGSNNAKKLKVKKQQEVKYQLPSTSSLDEVAAVGRFSGGGDGCYYSDNTSPGLTSNSSSYHCSSSVSPLATPGGGGLLSSANISPVHFGKRYFASNPPAAATTSTCIAAARESFGSGYSPRRGHRSNSSRLKRRVVKSQHNSEPNVELSLPWRRVE